MRITPELSPAAPASVKANAAPAHGTPVRGKGRRLDGRCLQRPAGARAASGIGPG